MLARFFHVSHNTQMLGIKYAHLMIIFFNKDTFEFVYLKIKIKIDYEEKIEQKKDKENFKQKIRKKTKISTKEFKKKISVQSQMNIF
jgi:hypothetical protein